MGFFTEWFIADETEAEAIAKSDGPEFDWPNIAVKNIGWDELRELWAIILDEEVASAPSVVDKQLYQNKSGIILRINADFIAALADINTADVGRLSTVWSQTESLVSWPMPIDYLSEIIQMFANFAREAEGSGKPVMQFAAWL